MPANGRPPRPATAERKDHVLRKQLFDSATSTYSYLVADPDSAEAVLIDPVREQVQRDLQLIKELGLKLLYVLDTHIHADHVTGVGELRALTGCLGAVSSAANVTCADRKLSHGEHIAFGRYRLEVRNTPGHTDGCISLVLRDDQETFVFTGDALLIRGCGRTDFQQGNAKTLYRSIHQQIFTLPGDTTIYPGHDYNGHRSSTVAEEKAHNPRLGLGIEEAAFEGIMAQLQLAPPARLHHALPANLNCGIEKSRPVAASIDGPHREVSASAMAQIHSDLVLDVRSLVEFEGELGHFPQAIHAPLQSLQEQARSWDRHQAILLVCRSGRRSRIGCCLLRKLGFTNLSNLSGGMMAWHQLQEASA
jgi:sulfur dioxygenase